ncbi:MAG: MerR family transcriptional regulator [Alphaproteobacteria bacterium]|nr:MerR family transcriptional regulator [Alphaproteobacteria bacterium]
MTERTFTLAEVCAAVSISPARLHQWIERGQFEPIRGTRSGVARDFTLRDAIHLAAVIRLQSAGLPVSRAVALVGISPLETAGQDMVSARRGDVEVVIDLASITRDVRSRLRA